MRAYPGMQQQITHCSLAAGSSCFTCYSPLVERAVVDKSSVVARQALSHPSVLPMTAVNDRAGLEGIATAWETR
jgi:hypothetical protein